MSKYVYYQDSRSEWRWTFYAANGEEIAVSSESYVNKSDCVHAINLINKSTDVPVYERS